MTSIRILFIAPDDEAADSICSKLEEDLEIDELLVVPSFGQALGAYLETAFELCLVDQSLKLDQLEGFIRDTHKVENREQCVFVQVRPTLGNAAEREELREKGVKTIITADVDRYDRDYLLHALGLAGREVELKKRTDEIEAAMSSLLDQLDDASRERKRGRQLKLRSIFGELMKMHTSYDESLLETYFDVLLDQAEEAPPSQFHEIDVPDEVLDRSLPHLSNKRYSGQSARVWKRLLRRWGKRIQDGSTGGDV